MSFFEDIATALDAEGIESRVNDDVMFVPITSDLEIQFVEIDPILPAANVYIAAADVDEDDDEFEAVLVSVAFSVDDAVEAVARHVATDQVVTVLRDLLEGTDERIADLEFMQDEFNPNLVIADVAQESQLRVLVEVVDSVPTAVVRFLSFDLSAEFDDDREVEEDDFWVTDDSDELSDEDRQRLFGDDEDDIDVFDADDEFLDIEPVVEVPSETLELGTYTDFDRLFDILSLVADQADDWESQLVEFDEGEYDEPDVYDIFGADDFDDDVDYDDEDDELGGDDVDSGDSGDSDSTDDRKK